LCDAIVRIHTTATPKRQSAPADGRLNDEDGVIDAHDNLLSRISQLHESADEMKEWILTHDALLEPAVGPVHKTADDLFKALLEKP